MLESLQHQPFIFLTQQYFRFTVCRWLPKCCNKLNIIASHLLQFRKYNFCGKMKIEFSERKKLCSVHYCEMVWFLLWSMKLFCAASKQEDEIILGKNNNNGTNTIKLMIFTLFIVRLWNWE